MKTLLAHIESSLRQSLERMGEKTTLRDACEYALCSGGKRLRPLLVLLIAEALGFGLNAMPAALGVEYFHTASLIADDLPCMDDDALRRGRPTLHKAFPESAALLASYALIAEGYGTLAENAKELGKDPRFVEEAPRRALLCLEIVTRSAGLQGATQGQFLDLAEEETPNWKTFSEIVERKTSSLFEVAFVFGWVFGGGPLDRLEPLQKTARHLGMAFQIADDLEDEGHPKGSNILKFLGKKEAEALFQKEKSLFQTGMESLGLWSPEIQKLFRSFG